MTINRAKELEAANKAVHAALDELIEEGHEDQICRTHFSATRSAV